MFCQVCQFVAKIWITSLIKKKLNLGHVSWLLYAVCFVGFYTGDVLAVSFFQSQSAAEGIEIIRTSEHLFRPSRDDLALTLQPKHIRLWIPAFGFTF